MSVPRFDVLVWMKYLFFQYGEITWCTKAQAKRRLTIITFGGKVYVWTKLKELASIDRTLRSVRTIRGVSMPQKYWFEIQWLWSSKINDIKFQIGVHVYICTGFVNGSTIRRLTMRVKATLLALPNYWHATRGCQPENAMGSVHVRGGRFLER